VALQASTKPVNMHLENCLEYAIVYLNLQSIKLLAGMHGTNNPVDYSISSYTKRQPRNIAREKKNF